MNKNEFEALIAQKDKLVVVDFWAEWCGPCKMLAPVLEEIEKEYGDVSFGKVNVDEEGELAVNYGIQYIPTLLFFKNGEIIKKASGYITPDELRSAIDNAL